MRVSKPGEQKWLKALIFGPAGQGKTHFLGTAQLDTRTSPMLLLDFEGGEQTLVGLDIDIVRIRSWEDYFEVYEELSQSRDLKYKSVGIDSISETHIFALLDLLDQQGAQRRDPDLLQQQDYGKAGTQMRRLLRSFRDLPVHVFFTSLAKEVVEARVGTVKVPALAGQLAEEVPGLMDLTGYMAISQEKDPRTAEIKDVRSLLLKNFSQFRVKVRTGWGDVDCPDLIEDPTVTKLLDALKFQTSKPESKKEVKKNGEVQERDPAVNPA